ncbi:hypothetical protein PHLGIDRAFT_111814 [Phlebiopsis gigantea 11061_1 CR5-6]|uniref:HNH nuclease domain-containing protein n=1 Tax=Phlebiopsis gigantea (strain 11061_1 CR5-6) TaxID=745531 RepID=A0A0C3PC75_PHLG1|nr:hypothetical protein PHLGIDRAFT_111814 [Phlebiopsis gigantea 11061_1 CR5-6]
MHARIVGYLLIYLYELRSALGSQAVGQAAHEAISNSNASPNKVIYQLGLRFREGLLRSFRQAKGLLPQVSEHPSRPSFSTLEDMMKDCLEGSGTDYQSSRKKALARDGFRCMLTGILDTASAKKLEDFNEPSRVPTSCCHILSQSTVQDVNSAELNAITKREWASNVLAILSIFGYQDLAMQSTYHLSNIITMSQPLCTLFNSLALWLEPTGVESQYKICAAHPADIAPWNVPSITPQFKDHTGGNLPLPCPELLALHAACAKVAHMSGAAQFFDKQDADDEDATVLAYDGSSHSILSNKLQSLTI